MFEYYGGILFLTTNRAGDIDAAFQSRIPVGIRYLELGSNARESTEKISSRAEKGAETN